MFVSIEAWAGKDRATLTANDDGDLADQADPEERIDNWQSPHAVERLVPESDVGEDRVRSELRGRREEARSATKRKEVGACDGSYSIRRTKSRKNDDDRSKALAEHERSVD